MQNPALVAELLAWEAYHSSWPDIPENELRASAVSLPIGCSRAERLVLLHKRRVNEEQRRGMEPVHLSSSSPFRFRVPFTENYSMWFHFRRSSAVTAARSFLS